MGIQERKNGFHTMAAKEKSFYKQKGFKMGTAVQLGDQIVISNQFGTVSRKFKGRLISYLNGILTYVPFNGGLCSFYVGL